MTTAEMARDRVLTDDELRAIWRATANGTLVGSSAFFSLLLPVAAKRRSCRGVKSLKAFGPYQRHGIRSGKT